MLKKLYYLGEINDQNEPNCQKIDKYKEIQIGDKCISLYKEISHRVETTRKLDIGGEMNEFINK